MLKVLKGAMELHDARIRWRCKRFLKRAPKKMQGRTIYHEMQHIHKERGEQSTKNKLILLLPTKKKGLMIEEEPAELSKI